MTQVNIILYKKNVKDTFMKKKKNRFYVKLLFWSRLSSNKCGQF